MDYAIPPPTSWVKIEIYSTMSDNSFTACIVFQYKTLEGIYLL